MPSRILARNHVVMPSLLRLVNPKSAFRHSTLLFFRSAGQEKQHCHTNGDAACHLVQDDRIGSVSDIRINFDSAVDGARVHDDCIWLGGPHTLRAETIVTKVFPNRWKESLLLPL